jgi:hypothetical protein
MKIFKSKIKILLLLIVVVFDTCSFASQKPQLLDVVNSEALSVMGEPENMAHRSSMFLWMFLDSKRQLPFSASVSHLTLAIERSISFGHFKETLPLFDSTKGDMELWKSTLQVLNQEMFYRTYLAYRLAQEQVERNVKLSEKELNSKTFAKIQTIYPVMLELHQSLKNGLNLSEQTQDRHFESLVRWEHEEFFQPRLKKVFDKLGFIMRNSLSFIPGEYLEGYIMKPLLGMRTTLSLSCFNDPNRKLRTRNFMDYEQRIDQAREFYGSLKQIAFDPSLQCYNDSYYLSHFDKALFRNPLGFLGHVRDQSISEKGYLKPITDVNRGVLIGFKSKTSAKHLIKSLKNIDSCRETGIEFWQRYANNFINVPDTILHGSGPIISKRERDIVINALINKSYIELFHYFSQARIDKGGHPYTWLGSAAFGSFSVGKLLSYGLYNKIEDKQLKKEKKLSNALASSYSEAMWDNMKELIVQNLPKSAIYASVLAKGNQAVFHDIFWQFLALSQCGPNFVVKLLEQSEQKSDVNSRSAWKKFASKPIEANLKLLRVEQEDVLQDLLYEAIGAKHVSAMKIFNSFAGPGTRGEGGKELMNFDQYCEHHSIDNDLSKLESRMPWLNYIVSGHSQYFSQLHELGLLGSAFKPITDYNRSVLESYK